MAPDTTTEGLDERQQRTQDRIGRRAHTILYLAAVGAYLTNQLYVWGTVQAQLVVIITVGALAFGVPAIWHGAMFETSGGRIMSAVLNALFTGMGVVGLQLQHGALIADGRLQDQIFSPAIILLFGAFLLTTVVRMVLDRREERDAD